MKDFSSHNFVCIFASAFILVLSCVAQTTRANSRTIPSLGLPRLGNQTSDGSAPVGRGKFTEDALTAQGVTGTRTGERRGARFLILNGKTEFSRSLRGSSKDILFVSFSVYGSPGTFLGIGGARLSITESIVVPGCAQLMFLDRTGEWQPTGLNVPFDFHEKKVLALMPVLTVRLDPDAGTFDIYQSAQLLAEDLPLQPDKSGHKLTLTAGLDGAQINGLVQSDENPLYPDANSNAIDDRFEQTKKGRLLTGTDTKADRKALIEQWRTDQITHPAPALFVNLPLPDGD